MASGLVPNTISILRIIHTKVTQALFNRLLAAELLIPVYVNGQVSSFLF